MEMRDRTEKIPSPSRQIPTISRRRPCGSPLGSPLVFAVAMFFLMSGSVDTRSTFTYMSPYSAPVGRQVLVPDYLRLIGRRRSPRSSVLGPRSSVLGPDRSRNGGGRFDNPVQSDPSDLD